MTSIASIIHMLRSGLITGIYIGASGAAIVVPLLTNNLFENRQ